MRRKLAASSIIFTLLLLLTGCTGPLYIQQTDTPANLEGFLGFRWITPLSILDDHMLQTFDVIPNQRYNNYYSLAYDNFYFMDKKTSLCKFIFNDHGLIQVNLFFRPEPENVFPELDYLLEKLTRVYGSPVQMTRPAFEHEYMGYTEGYYWFNGRLNITLMPGDFIIIRAFGSPQGPPDEPPPPPPPQHRYTRVDYNKDDPPMIDFRLQQGIDANP